jgi:protein TonB
MWQALRQRWRQGCLSPQNRNSMEQQETKRKRIAFLTSAGVHGIILLLFLFSMAWRAPDPPLPEFGIELNFGDSDAGSGDIQPETPTASEQEPVEDQLVQEETQPEESKPEIVPSTQESAVTEPKEEKPVTTETKPEEKKEEVKPATPPSTTGNQPQSQGDDKDKTGDKGDTKGVPDPNAAYTGKPGGGNNGNGMSLSMSGWAWADQPKLPDIPDNEDGRIVFEIECDEEGEIIGIKTLERGLSPRAEQLLVQEIRRNSLMRTGGGEIPPRSKGTVVFILKTK